MEKFQELADKAKKSINIADHMLTVTYPLVKDPKLIPAIMENIFIAYSSAVDAILYFDLLYKRIPVFHDSFESKLNTFNARCISRYKIKKYYITEIQTIKNLLEEHKKSPVEFSRKDSFVIFSDKFKMKAISINTISEYINKAKVFIEEMDNIISKQ